MRAKVNKSEQVTINDRCPKWLSVLLRRNRKRTVKSVYYDHERKCRYFYLGSNNQGEAAGFIEQYPFRSYMLDREVAGRGIGRPKRKRRYKCRHTAIEDSINDGLHGNNGTALVKRITALSGAL